MADKKITDLTELTVVASDDLLEIVDTSTNTTKKIQVANLMTDGWIPITVTWAYASATTITVPSGAAAIYSVGDKVKLTQTTVKYFYIVGVADTVLTITGGTDFTLADEAITSPYYSHAASPIGFPQWFTTFLNVQGTSPTTVDIFRFTIQGRLVVGTLYVAGTGAAPTYTGTLPVSCAVGENWISLCGNIWDNGAAITTVGRAVITQGTSGIAFYTNLATGGWTTANTRSVRSSLFYQI